jgi:hypothetical protein
MVNLNISQQQNLFLILFKIFYKYTTNFHNNKICFLYPLKYSLNYYKFYIYTTNYFKLKILNNTFSFLFLHHC